MPILPTAYYDLIGGCRTNSILPSSIQGKEQNWNLKAIRRNRHGETPGLVLSRAKVGSHERKITDEKTPLDDRPSSLETEKPETKRPDVLHFVEPTDSVSSVVIRYGVPAAILRRANALFSDHLLAARRTIVIPGEHYGGASLSPRPPGGEEEARKGKIRRLMVRCKVAE
jgi:LysM repeat protein